MSADACVVFYGLRYMVFPAELNNLEARRDPRQIAARKTGLDTYWGNFGGEEHRYVLFVGRKLVVLGPEDQAASTIRSEQLSAIMTDTDALLSSIGLSGEVGLHTEWLLDA